MGLILPDYAQPIVDARRKGKRPAGLVIVGDKLDLRYRFPDNPCVRYPRTRHPAAFDWRFLRGLDVEIATLANDARLVELIDAVDRAEPNYLRAWHIPTDGMLRIRFFGVRMVCKESRWLCG